MCAPMALAAMSFGLGAMQSVASYEQQSAMAERQNQYYQQNRDAANKALVNSYAGEQNQQIQERNAASQKAYENEIKGTEARGTAITAAGAAGVGGLSVSALLGDYYSRESDYRDSVDSNYFMQRDYIRSEMEGSQAQADSRINSVQTAVPPSFADAALRIGGSAVGAAGQYYRDTYLTQPWNGSQLGISN